MIASVATYPHEVLRTRLQIQKHLTELPPPPLLNPMTLEGASKPRIIPTQEGVVQTCKRIVREEGLAGFYRGMGVNLLRTVPASAMTILTYVIFYLHRNVKLDSSSDAFYHSLLSWETNCRAFFSYLFLTLIGTK